MAEKRTIKTERSKRSLMCGALAWVFRIKGKKVSCKNPVLCARWQYVIGSMRRGDVFT